MSMTPASALRKDLSHAGDLSGFQHRHYAALAGIVRTVADVGERDRLTHLFVDHLTVNSNFNRARFEAACKAE